MVESEYINDVISAFKNRVRRIREAAFTEAANIPLSQEVRAALLESIKDEKEEAQTRVLIIKALQVHGKEEKIVQDVLSNLLYHEDQWIRFAAAQAYHEVGGDAKHIVPVLIMLCSSNPPELHVKAADMLGSLGKQAAVAVRPLARIACSDSEDEGLRIAALNALANIGEASREVSGDIVLCMIKDSPTVCHFALCCLKRIGADRAAIPDIIEVLTHVDEKTGEVCSKRIGFFIMNAWDTHKFVIKLLGALGPDAKAAIPVLEDLLTWTTDPDVERERRKMAVRTAAYQRPVGRGRRRVEWQQPTEKDLFPPLKSTSVAAQEVAKEALARIKGEPISEKLVPQT